MQNIAISQAVPRRQPRRLQCHARENKNDCLCRPHRIHLPHHPHFGASTSLDLESGIIVWDFKRPRGYLGSAKFLVLIDHEALGRIA